MRGVNMLILSMKKHFPARAPEWFMALLLLIWGTYTVLHPQIFSQPETQQVLSGMAAMAGGYPPAAVWGLASIFVATSRLGALFVNGAYTRTPLIRLITSFASAFILTQVAVGLLKTGIPNWGLVVYPSLVFLDLVSVYRASVDFVYAEKTRHELKEMRRDADARRRSVPA